MRRRILFHVTYSCAHQQVAVVMVIVVITIIIIVIIMAAYSRAEHSANKINYLTYGDYQTDGQNSNH